VINLIRHKTVKELVDPEMREVMLHPIQAAARRVFLLTLSTRSPMNIPATL
jgi:hypothetical protein